MRSSPRSVRFVLADRNVEPLPPELLDELSSRAMPPPGSSTAPTTKNGVVDPVIASRYGKARLVTNDPMFPAMFIVPDTAPAFDRPMSMQNAHEGGSVMSDPNIASVRHNTAGIGV